MNPLHPRIHLRQECASAIWSEELCLWRVSFVDRATNGSYIQDCRILISAVGFLDVPKGPDCIDGIEAFRRKVFHSSKWNHEVDLHDKDVLVVGNGASATQFVPWLLGNMNIRSLAY